MPKEKSYNPAQEFHKKRKRDHIKKAKAEKQKLQYEKLARRDVNKIEAQIQEFKRLEMKGQLSALDRSNLEILESDLKRIRKARKYVGPIIESEKTKAREAKEEKQQQKIPKNPEKSIYYDPIYNPYGVPPPGMPYKEWSDIEDDETSSNEPSTPESISTIPMPEGSPPPFSYLDKRKKRHQLERFKHPKTLDQKTNTLHSSYSEKQSENNKSIEGPSQPTPTPTPTIVYSADSILRDLRKESTTFVPTAVRQRKILQHSSLKKNITSKPALKQNPVFKPKPSIHINAAPDILDDT
ncbi:hypothetical protein T552_00386 [Pneumocystis carinii B80]|uniref:Wbp11/ELF5/Saf1 N-terminal domain-containing protein n=1 Tax=Pneumocystis carinii (strain B80) TaxID=1408658 RepID=A0A0W4ZQN3_PNEC8|nr:hypothetical protein T552_00386 [Pneumocystis carinii B80]KTW30673.1 hypothetical protein T552_00386 [Pneumocystis carinii B80]